MSEHHYHLKIKNLPEEYAEKYPDFVRLVTHNGEYIAVNFTEPRTLSLCGATCDNYDGETNLGNVVEFLLAQVANSAYGYPTPEKSDFLRYCELEEKPDCKNHLRIKQQRESQA